MGDLFGAVEALDNKVAAALQAKLLAECGRLIERSTVWFLRHGGHPLDIRARVETYAEGVAQLGDNLEGLLTEADLKVLEEQAVAYEEQGTPDGLAHRVASLGLLVPACDIVDIARAAGVSVLDVGRAYFTIGARFGFDWLRRAAGHLPSDSAWDKLAVTAIVDDLYGSQSELTSRVVNGRDLGVSENAIDDWAEAHVPLVVRTEQLLAELQSAGGGPDLAMLAVANRQLRSMVTS
jgi:glutamate dehydrogenase